MINESSSAGTFSKWLVITGIAACLINLAMCVYTAMMAYKTSDMVDLTKESMVAGQRVSEPKSVIKIQPLKYKLLEFLKNE